MKDAADATRKAQIFQGGRINFARPRRAPILAVSDYGVCQGDRDTGSFCLDG